MVNSTHFLERKLRFEIDRLTKVFCKRSHSKVAEWTIQNLARVKRWRNQNSSVVLVCFVFWNSDFEGSGHLFDISEQVHNDTDSSVMNLVIWQLEGCIENFFVAACHEVIIIDDRRLRIIESFMVKIFQSAAHHSRNQEEQSDDWLDHCKDENDLQTFSKHRILILSMHETIWITGSVQQWLYCD